MTIISEEHLQSDLAGLPSNTIGQQLWCVIGARQIYLKAILNNGWQGFGCGLGWSDTGNKVAVQEQLSSSKTTFLSSLADLKVLTSVQQSLLIDLIEHEAQHHGQLVRYLYGLKCKIPESWKKRYSLD